MKHANLTRALLVPWLFVLCFVGSHLSLKATTDSISATFCPATNEALVVSFNVRVTFTINPAQVAPPDNVIVQHCSFVNNVSSPQTLCGLELGGATGTILVEWSTNGGSVYYSAGSGAIGVAVGPFFMGSDYCSLPPTNIYCITPTVCNNGLYSRQYRFRSDASGGFSASMYISPPLNPGQCYTFPTVCTDDKSKLHISYTDFTATGDGGAWEAKEKGTLEGPTMTGWSTNTSVQTTTTPATNSPPSLTPTFNPTQAGNSNIAYTGSNTNVATDGTLKEGLNGLYKATVDGFQLTVDTLNSGFGNANSNLIRGNAIVGNGFGSLSNILGGISNRMAGQSGQLSGLSNQLAGLSNGIGNLGNTEFGESNILSAITNRMNASTNSGIGSGNVTTWTSSGTTAAGTQKDALDGLRGSVPGDAGTVGSGIGAWTLSIGGQSADYNPLGGSWSGVSTWIRAAFLWVATVLYGMFLCKITLDAMRGAASARQATSAASTPVASTGVALLMAGGITVALGAIPALLVTTFNSGILTILGANTWGSGGVVANGIGLLNSFIPVDAITTYALSSIVYMMTVGSVFWLATTVVRFLVGCILIFGGIAAMDAAERSVIIHNLGTKPLTVLSDGFGNMTFNVPAGRDWVSPSAVSDASSLQVSYYQWGAGFSDTNYTIGLSGYDFRNVEAFVGDRKTGDPYVIDSDNVAVGNFRSDFEWMKNGAFWSILPCTFMLGMLIIKRIFGGGSEAI